MVGPGGCPGAALRLQRGPTGGPVNLQLLRRTAELVNRVSLSSRLTSGTGVRTGGFGAFCCAWGL